MTTLHIEHPITDFAAGGRAYDRFADRRRQAGVHRRARSAQPVDDEPLRRRRPGLPAPGSRRSGSWASWRRTVWASRESSPALAGTPPHPRLLEPAGDRRSARAVDAGARRRAGGQPLRRDRPAAGLADAVVAGLAAGQSGLDVGQPRRACSSSATTCCRSKAIVAPSGSCSSSALDDRDAATTSSNSRVSASIWASAAVPLGEQRIGHRQPPQQPQRAGARQLLEVAGRDAPGV